MSFFSVICRPFLVALSAILLATNCYAHTPYAVQVTDFVFSERAIALSAAERYKAHVFVQEVYDRLNPKIACPELTLTVLTRVEGSGNSAYRQQLAHMRLVYLKDLFKRLGITDSAFVYVGNVDGPINDDRWTQDVIVVEGKLNVFWAQNVDRPDKECIKTVR